MQHGKKQAALFSGSLAVTLFGASAVEFAIIWYMLLAMAVIIFIKKSFYPHDRKEPINPGADESEEGVAL